jgi:hypothetical protein
VKPEKRKTANIFHKKPMTEIFHPGKDGRGRIPDRPAPAETYCLKPAHQYEKCRNEEGSGGKQKTVRIPCCESRTQEIDRGSEKDCSRQCKGVVESNREPVVQPFECREQSFIDSLYDSHTEHYDFTGTELSILSNSLEAD